VTQCEEKFGAQSEAEYLFIWDGVFAERRQKGEKSVKEKRMKISQNSTERLSETESLRGIEIVENSENESRRAADDAELLCGDVQDALAQSDVVREINGTHPASEGRKRDREKTKSESRVNKKVEREEEARVKQE
jgi:hypothetical protein